MKPKDIDVVLAKDYVALFNGWMKRAEYVGSLDDHNDTMVWKKAGRLPVESYSVEDDPNDTMIGPVADPDYDVNTLCYDGRQVYSWVNPDTDLGPIIDHVRKKRAEQLGKNVTQERKAKIIAKGYTII